jgi:hypothetical protein
MAVRRDELDVAAPDSGVRCGNLLGLSKPRAQCFEKLRRASAIEGQLAGAIEESTPVNDVMDVLVK